MITGTLKLVSIVTALFLSASPQSLQLEQNISARAICTDAAPLKFDNSFYQAQTRKSLERLGESNHPVGLYWLAHKDLRRDKINDAIKKLERAAEQGLADAYFRLAEIYTREKDHTQAQNARLCGQALETKALQL